MSQLFKNNAKSRLLSSISDTALSFSVLANEGNLFPVIPAGDHILVTLENSSGDKEIVRVSARSVDSFTISGDTVAGESALQGRGREGTTVRGFSANDLVELRLTAGFIDSLKEGSIVYVIDGGGAAITTGVKGFIEAPFNGSIKSVRLFADVAGDIIINIYKTNYTGYDPGDLTGDSIVSITPPTLSGVFKSEDSALVGWTTQFAKGDIFYFVVEGTPATITRVTLSMTVDRF